MNLNSLSNTKLEFGNSQQIAELKSQIELADSETYEMEMQISGSRTVTIEGAKTEREAKQKARDNYFDDLVDSSDVSFHYIRKVPTKKPAPKIVSMSMFKEDDVE